MSTDAKQREIDKAIRARKRFVVLAVIGASLVIYGETKMGPHTHASIKNLYLFLFGAVMFFMGGFGTVLSTIVLRLKRKEKDKAW